MKVAIVTGASSGIGKEIFKELSKTHIVYNLSRTIANPTEFDIVCDVTNEQNVIEAIKQVVDKHGKLDVVVNNAGIGVSGALEFSDLNSCKNLFDVNLFGCFLVTKHCLPHLRTSKGKILFTSSVASCFSIPFQTFYSASKAALNSFVNGLHNEVKPFGISVCSVLLGDVKSDFTKNRKKIEVGDDIYKNRINKSVAVMEHDEQNGMSPNVVAKKFVKLINKRKLPTQITVGFKYKFFMFLNWLMPKKFILWLIRSIYG